MQWLFLLAAPFFAAVPVVVWELRLVIAAAACQYAAVAVVLSS